MIIAHLIFNNLHIADNINLDITSVFKTPLIPGPASDYKAIYTALMRAQAISVWSCGKDANTIVSLDLDLYQRANLLMNSREDMKNRYVVRLGELHTVFAHIRAIGSFIACSGLDEAWIECGWFDSDCLVQQVLECKHMKRALEAHEASMIAVEILLLSEMVKTYPKFVANKDLLSSIVCARTGLSESNDQNRFQLALHEYSPTLDNVQFKEKWDNFLSLKERNLQFMFLYCRMVKRLLQFIEASRTRNWQLHLSSCQALMQDLISMDRCKYRKSPI